MPVNAAVYTACIKTVFGANAIVRTAIQVKFHAVRTALDFLESVFRAPFPVWDTTAMTGQALT